MLRAAAFAVGRRLPGEDTLEQVAEKTLAYHSEAPQAARVFQQPYKLGWEERVPNLPGLAGLLLLPRGEPALLAAYLPASTNLVNGGQSRRDHDYGLM